MKRRAIFQTLFSGALIARLFTIPKGLVSLSVSFAGLAGFAGLAKPSRAQVLESKTSNTPPLVEPSPWGKCPLGHTATRQAGYLPMLVDVPRRFYIYHDPATSGTIKVDQVDAPPSDLDFRLPVSVCTMCGTLFQPSAVNKPSSTQLEVAH